MFQGYHEGWNAFANGTYRCRNPYAEGLKAWYEWFKGWDAAAVYYSR